MTTTKCDSCIFSYLCRLTVSYWMKNFALYLWMKRWPQNLTRFCFLRDIDAPLKFKYCHVNLRNKRGRDALPYIVRIFKKFRNLCLNFYFFHIFTFVVISLFFYICIKKHLLYNINYPYTGCIINHISSLENEST